MKFKNFDWVNNFLLYSIDNADTVFNYALLSAINMLVPLKVFSTFNFHVEHLVP